MTGGLYPYQRHVAELLLEGRSVVLQAPTGAGKTRCALLPFLHARLHLPPERFPRKCIYSVPMRVLATQFVEEWGKIVHERGWQQELAVTIQTGAQAIDPKLEGDLIFTTIDQTLSNFLNIPFALSTGQSNLNAGAIVSSYLVVDELHLLDPGSTLPTTLHMLKLVKGVIPFLVMTATFSSDQVEELARLLDAVPVIVSGDEAADIPSQNKTRRMTTVDCELTADYVLRNHQRRSIAFCNTVNRAQALYDSIRSQCSFEVRLLHSRFLRKDRDSVEAWLRREFGKDKSAYSVDSAILIATQAAEVGLDITSEQLHTEIAPASSVLQRSGRCARYAGEVGDVFVYRVPLNKGGKPNFAPYSGVDQPRIAELTWDALKRRSGLAYDFDEELAMVNEAHGEADRRMIERLRASRGALADRIARTMRTRDIGAASELIRDADSRTVILHPSPESLENPWAFEGFSIALPTVKGGFAAMEQLADTTGEQWIMCYARPEPQEEGTRTKTVWIWDQVRSREQVASCLLLAANPALVYYSSQVGLRLGIAGDPRLTSPLATLPSREKESFVYERETMLEHVYRMHLVCEGPSWVAMDGQHRQPLFDEVAYAMQHLELKCGWSSGTLKRLARLVICVHDLGKLDTRWQRWAHEWQDIVSTLRGEELRVPVDVMLAHTDYNCNDPEERQQNKQLRQGRPNHAVEGAASAMSLIRREAGDVSLARAALSAIVGHHAAGTEGSHGEYAAHPAASTSFREAVLALGLALEAEPSWRVGKGDIRNRMIDFSSERELLAYLYLVRVLRLADQRSQSI